MSYGMSNGNDMVMPVALMDAAESDYERQEIMKMIEAIEKQKR